MAGKEQIKIDALIKLWVETNNNIYKIENSYTTLISLLMTIFGAIIVYFSGDLVPQDLFDYKFLLLMIMPVAIASLIAYISYQFRWVAISRMYLTAVEKEINNLLGENYYSWNSDVVEKFVVHNNFANTILLPMINGLFFVLCLFYFDYCMIASDLHLLVKILYVELTAAIVLVCLIPFVKNSNVRKKAYEFPKTKDIVDG